MPRATDDFRDRIRTVPDWPQAGIQFRDITPLLQDADTFQRLIDCFVQRYLAQHIDLVAGIDARGFILGAALAYALRRGFVPIRKKGKLPFQTIAEDYALEYGAATIELHIDAVAPGQRVLLVDDLVATGGTLLAAARLIRRLGGEVVEAAAIVDLPELGGSAAVAGEGITLFTLCQFDGH
ncbi:adenine phosphoribosyltransferase [Chitinimonas sp. BJYL2]|uniref:adenine phosphoribosyltransferase n=1 Tax=Chitinimonas sp. BJYL2 TaxID=2976696 RepID=UPI0022B4FF8A|nr:adenine phosphoribosyltransferase [Chitinimonas sp. BJYL2]